MANRYYTPDERDEIIRTAVKLYEAWTSRPIVAVAVQMGRLGKVLGLVRTKDSIEEEVGKACPITLEGEPLAQPTRCPT